MSSSTSASSTARLTSSGFRKVELQSPADLHHLTALSQRAARAKIDAAFPPSAAPTDGEDDGMRRRVEELVARFVEGTWDGVRRNVTCNGVDLAVGGGKDGLEEEFEPLDARMVERIRVLEAEKERLTLRVTGLRREAPAAAAENFRARWRSEQDAFDTQLAAEEAGREEGGSVDVDVDVGAFRRWDDVKTSYERSTDQLVRLKTGLTETVARLERAKGVVGYMESQDS